MVVDFTYFVLFSNGILFYLEYKERQYVVFCIYGNFNLFHIIVVDIDILAGGQNFYGRLTCMGGFVSHCGIQFYPESQTSILYTSPKLKT